MSSNAYNANFLFHGVYANTRIYLIGKIIGLLFLLIPCRASVFCEVLQTKCKKKRLCEVTNYFFIFNNLAIFFLAVTLLGPRVDKHHQCTITTDIDGSTKTVESNT